MEARLARVEKRVASQEQKLTRLSDSVNENNRMTKDMYDIFQAVQGGFKVLGWLGNLAKLIWPLLAAGTAVIVFFKTGVWSPPK
jgi:hypothetical protein